MITEQDRVQFSLTYMKSFVQKAQRAGYTFYTMSEYLDAGCPKDHAFVLKHDLDFKPKSLDKLLDVQRSLEIRSTIFVRVAGAPYNPVSYSTQAMLAKAEAQGCELGLHTNALEFATINGLDTEKVFESELRLLRAYHDVHGMSCHRDFNYAHNMLPWLQERWNDIKIALALEYEAYEDRFTKNTVYINEGMLPHLCWRLHTPEEVIETGESIYLLTHPNWWHIRHPFENYDP